MGQKEILDFLAKYPNRVFTKAQIEEALGETRGHVCVSLAQLRNSEEVEYFKGPPPPSGGRSAYHYKHKECEDFKIIVRRPLSLEI
jgi:predicted transcriptional regulator